MKTRRTSHRRGIFGAILVAALAGISVVLAPAAASASPSVAGTPTAIALNSVTNTVYVTSANGTVSVINGFTNKVTAVISDAAGPLAVAVNPTTNRIYVANNDGSMSVIKGSTNTIIATITGVADYGEANKFHIVATPSGVAVNSATNSVYETYLHYDATGNSTCIMSVLSGGRNVVTSSIDTTLGGSYGCGAPVTDLRNNRIYVSGGGGDTQASVIIVIDGKTNKVVPIPGGSTNGFTLDVGSGAYPPVTVDTSTDAIYAAPTQDPGPSIWRINPTTDTAATPLRLANPNFKNNLSLTGIAVNTANHTVYATSHQGIVTVVDGPTLKVKASINDAGTVAEYESATVVAANSITNTVYAINSNGVVSVINGATNTVSATIALNGPAPLVVQVYSSNGGGGTVTSTPAGIACPGTCSATFPVGTQVTLHEVADSASVLSHPTATGCTPIPSGGDVAADCVLSYTPGASPLVAFTKVTAVLRADSNVGQTGGASVEVDLNACGSTGARSYQFVVDHAQFLFPSGNNCSVGDTLPVGKHTVTLTAFTALNDRRVTVTRSLDVSPIAAFSWKVDPIPYGETVTKTMVHFNACQSAGTTSFRWRFGGGVIKDQVTSDCHLDVELSTGRSTGVTLYVGTNVANTTQTSSSVYVPALYLQPSTACSTFAIDVNACWRRGVDWFGDVFGISGNAKRPPDYAFLAISTSGGGLTTISNIAVTCDGNVYGGQGIGATFGAGDGVSVSTVLGYGYVGDPTTLPPTTEQIDSFVNGETDSTSASSFGAGVSYVHSPMASGPQVGVEYYGGFTGPSVGFSKSYDVPAVGDHDEKPGVTCTGGVTHSPEWQALTNQPIESGAGLTHFDPLTGQAPTVGPGAVIYVDVPAGTFAPGTDITLTAHSTPLYLATVAADKTGAIGARIHLPTSLTQGRHELLLTGIGPDRVKTKTLSMTFTITGTSPAAQNAAPAQSIRSSAGTPAATGPSLLTPLDEGFALIMVGIACTLAGGRRRHPLRRRA